MEIAVCTLHPLSDPRTLLIVWVHYVKFFLVQGRITAAIVSCRQNSSDTAV